jgi:hypothetical protein
MGLVGLGGLVGQTKRPRIPGFGFRGLGGAGEGWESYTGGLQVRIPAMSLSKTTTSLIGSRALALRACVLAAAVVRVRMAMDAVVPWTVVWTGATTRVPPVTTP